MATTNLKNINFMTEAQFDAITPADDELYAVEKDFAATDLSNVSDNIDYVVESYMNGTEWYRIYKSGWCEQGGFVSPEAVAKRIYLMKSYRDSTYTIVLTAVSFENDDVAIVNFKGTSQVQADSFPVIVKNYANYSYYANYYWKTAGYIF